MEHKKKKKLCITIVSLCMVCALLLAGLYVGNDYMANAGMMEAYSNTILNSNESLFQSAIVPNASNEILGHTLVSENDLHQLYLYEPTLSIIVRDKKTGAIMESTVREDDGKSNATWLGFTQSGISFELQEESSNLQKKIDLVNSGAEIHVELINGGFKADIDYRKYQIGFTTEVRLHDDGSLIVTIPEESIYENDPQKYRIGNIYVYPFLGYTHLGDRDGYMIVPDGNGALIYLDDKRGRFSEGYAQPVYGKDIGTHKAEVLSLLWDKYETHNEAELILAPIYGMVHADSQMGYLAVIEGGAQDATIEATPNGAYTSYNWIGSKYRKACTYKQLTSKTGGSNDKVTEERFAYDIQVRYIFASGDDATYAGLANQYREYLIGRGDLKEKNDEFKIRLDFMGSDVENWLIFKKNVTMTTTDQIRDIYDELREENVTQILSLYKGWQSGGINNLPVKKFKAESNIGGNKKIKKLIQDANDMGINLYLYQDMLRINPDASNTMFSTVSVLSKRTYEENTYKKVYETMNYLLPEKTEANMKSLTKAFKKNGINTMALSGISNNIYTHINNNTIYTRTNVMENYESYIAATNQEMNLLLEKPIEKYWKYTEAMLDMPVGDSDYIYTDENIPFLSIVLKGMIPMYGTYVNFEANQIEYFLKLIETGIYPSFYLTYENPTDLIYTNSNDIYSAEYSVYKEQITSYYHELKEFNDLVQGAYIINHYVENGVTTVVYDNGVTVYINYGETEQSIGNRTVPAKSYQIGGV